MVYIHRYKTPEGFSNLLMNSDGEALTGLWFENSQDASKRVLNCEEKELTIFKDTCRWLDVYFSGKQPDFTPEYKIKNLTPFRKEVIDEMLKIPFGAVVSYGYIANTLARKHGKAKMSAQAVGGAVGWNPLCIIIPCHRVVGTNMNLTGYGGGIQNKISLLSLEGNDMNMFPLPKKMEQRPGACKNSAPNV